MTVIIWQHDVCQHNKKINKYTNFSLLLSKIFEFSMNHFKWTSLCPSTSDWILAHALINLHAHPRFTLMLSQHDVGKRPNIKL